MTNSRQICRCGSQLVKFTGSDGIALVHGMVPPNFLQRLSMKLSLVLTMVLLLSLASCGGKKGNSNTKKTTTISQQQIEAVMENQEFECAALNGGGCPAGIARLLILNKEDADKSAVCSGFMVGEDTLVTNQHCIPDLAACKNTHIAIYNGLSYERAECERITAVLNDYTDPNDNRKKLDVSIVKINTKYVGEVFKASQTRPKTLDKVTIWAVDHTGLDRASPNLFEARITELECTVSSPTGRASLILNNCPVISGNSGSPVLNQSGSLIGVVWGATAAERIDSSYPLERRRNMDEQGAVTEVIYFKDFLPVQ